MLKNYITTIARHVLKHKAYSTINVLGLGLGMACFVFISLYIQDETSFDQFHERADQLYRVNKVVNPQDGATENHALTAGLLGEALVRNIPGSRRGRSCSPVV